MRNNLRKLGVYAFALLFWLAVIVIAGPLLVSCATTPMDPGLRQTLDCYNFKANSCMVPIP